MESRYKLLVAVTYFCAFLCQIPLLVDHMPEAVNVETSFNTYVPAVALILVGCFLFILDGLFPRCAEGVRLQLLSAVVLAIGCAVYTICGVSWSSRLCMALFAFPLPRDGCFGATFLNFFAVSCMLLYLTMAVVDGLFSAKARLMMLITASVMSVFHLLLSLLVYGYGGVHDNMATHLKFYYYFLIIYLSAMLTLAIYILCTTHHQRASMSQLTFSMLTIIVVCAILCAFGIIYGSVSYWHSHKLNEGDGAAFIGYAICHNTVNVWLMVELYLYKREKVRQFKRPNTSTTRSNYRYDAILTSPVQEEHDGVTGEYQQDPLHVAI